ncbi:dipeptidase D [Dethiosulfatibacter aminovorans DSM 17477]|uniref:Cytosol non-specific dipeptidase n=1 Tax=Dethiosulfatibacter aminovorans DSM 17477 TaxID=1121476 RepID=A0A1M6HPX5_9FIRM|nr:aminoacyl-histidine dipeptidase [Dethiosulfatibacter aminovorans]SHJ24285.1 dipeptidase D [Dethiosulfatibacter aminovorans DSM 17477]
MSRVLEGLKPERVFYNFEEISKIPRGSTNEKAISDYIVNWAEERGFKSYQDDVHNVVVYKEGTKGYENAPTVVLQGHLDMVCEKNEDSAHDFMTDPIKLEVRDDFIYADGTTLGGDNGVAIAMTMAILESEDIHHPPIEVLLTSDEETGMTGAMNLDPSVIDGRILLNLDSEGEGVFTTGCAGGVTVNFHGNVERRKSRYSKKYQIVIKGLKGGHSGADIHLDRINANKLMGRVINRIKDIVDVESINGGTADNAIPREAFAAVATDDAERLHAAIQESENIFENEYVFSDPGVQVEIKELADKPGNVFTDRFLESYLSLINLVPYGPLKINKEIDLVIQSNNPGVIKIEDDKMTIKCAARSSIESLTDDFVDKMVQLGSLTDFVVETKAFYPGWEYAKESYIRDVSTKVFRKEYGKNPQVMAIHAGLECGFFLKKIPDMDAISIGPDMYDIHTPEEHLSISSTERTFNLVKAILKDIK